MFEAFRCEDCHFGEYDYENNEWTCICGAEDEKECEQHYQDGEHM